jgi:hypothetical protein
MYNVNFSNSLGAVEPLEQGLWDSVPGDVYQDGKFIAETSDENFEYIEKMSPPLSKEAAEAMVAELTATLNARRAGLAARGIDVTEANVTYACDDAVCGVKWSYVAPVREWMGRQQFTTQSEAEAYLNTTLQMLQANGWEVLNSRVTDLDTPGYWCVVHTVDMTPLYLQMAEPGEGETLAPPIITDLPETIVIPAATMSRGKKIGLGLGIAGAVLLLGGIVTAVVVKKRNDADDAPVHGYGRYGRASMHGHYSKPRSRY